MLSKTINFTRYFADPSALTWDAFESGAFDRLPPSSTPKENGKRVGWCDPSNSLLPPSSEACRHEPWWFVGLRVDAWKKPSSFKHTLDLRKREWLSETGRERVPAQVVRELSEQLFLEAAVSVTRLVPVAISTQTGSVWVGAVSNQVQAAFEQAWVKSFPSELIQRKISEHLGSPRFLLWLWWRVEQGHTEVSAGDRAWDIWIDEQMEFEGGSSKSRVQGGKAGTMRPSYASLTAGLKLARVRLGFSTSGQDRSIMLGRPPEEVRSLKFTSVEPELDAHFYGIEEALGLVDELDAQYVSVANDPEKLERLEGSIDRWKADWNRTLAPATTEAS